MCTSKLKNKIWLKNYTYKNTRTKIIYNIFKYIYLEHCSIKVNIVLCFNIILDNNGKYSSNVCVCTQNIKNESILILLIHILTILILEQFEFYNVIF